VIALIQPQNYKMCAETRNLPNYTVYLEPI